MAHGSADIWDAAYDTLGQIKPGYMIRDGGFALITGTRSSAPMRVTRNEFHDGLTTETDKKILTCSQNDVNRNQGHRAVTIPAKSFQALPHSCPSHCPGELGVRLIRSTLIRR